ncbi:MAG: hypothetical protein HYY49_05165 [Ignavibacteriales bacterium]|nr:hypothetical protein [Ignavibacteriales bacterium]
MKTIDFFKYGISKVRRTKRMVFFAWTVNLLVALVLAFPLRNQLDAYIRNTVMEEKLVEKMKDEWLETYKYDYRHSEVSRVFNVSIFGSAPFFEHTHGLLNGAVVSNVGTFLSDLVFGFKIVSSPFNILVLIALLYAVLNSFLAGGFIGVYAREHRSSFQDFLMDGAKYFGRFFRLSFLSIVTSALFFAYIMSLVNAGILEWTRNEPSEMTPFTYYMVRNVLFFFAILLFMISLAYAKIRIVVDDRLSSILAFFAGFRFMLKNLRKTLSLYLLLILLGGAFIVMYAWLEAQFSQDAYWGILSIALIQQAFMLAYFWLKANFFAAQTSLYQDVFKREHSSARVS